MTASTASPKGGLDVAGPARGIGVAQVEDHGAFAVGAGGDRVGIDGLDGGGLAGMDEAVAVVAVAQVAFHGRGPGAFGAAGHGNHAGCFGLVAGSGRGAGRRTARWGSRRGTRRRRGHGVRRDLVRRNGSARQSPWNRRLGFSVWFSWGASRTGLIFRPYYRRKEQIRENFFDGVPVEADLIHPCHKGMGVFRSETPTGLPRG
jgi:hypothetical protein